MTDKSVAEIKQQSEGNSRSSRYRKITGINPFPKKGGSKKRHKTVKKRYKKYKKYKKHIKTKRIR